MQGYLPFEFAPNSTRGMARAVRFVPEMQSSLCDCGFMSKGGQVTGISKDSGMPP